MIRDTLPKEAVRDFYDRLGAGHDAGERYERAAKARALAGLAPAPGQWVLNVGAGTGKEQRQLETAVASAGGHSVGVDLSRTMLNLTRERVPAALLCEADAYRLPFGNGRFHRLLCTYVLDLMPLADIPAVLAEFRRVLRPGGLMALVSLSSGVDWPSKLLMGLWRAAYTLSPVALGGCRPLHLQPLVQRAGFTIRKRTVVVQWGMPSEVIIGVK